MAGRRYDTEELQRIATLRDRDFSIQAVAREVGRTPSGIQSALRARGWIDSARGNVCARLKPAETEMSTLSPDLAAYGRVLFAFGARQKILSQDLQALLSESQRHGGSEAKAAPGCIRSPRSRQTNQSCKSGARRISSPAPQLPHAQLLSLPRDVGAALEAVPKIQARERA